MSPRTGKLPWVLLPLVLTYLAIAMNMTIAGIALPTISVDFRATAGQLAWVVSVTPMVAAACLPFAGAWGDKWGHKRLLTAGILVFLAAAVLSGLANSVEMLIAMRGLTGLGSALAMPSALAITFSLASGPVQRTAVGVMGSAQAIGVLLGPLVGGAVLTLSNWHVAFWSITPLLAIALVLNVVALPADEPGSSRSVDYVGALLAAMLGISLLYAAASAASLRWLMSVVALLLAVVALWALVRWEPRVADPLFDSDVMRRRAFIAPTVALVLVQFTLGGLIFLNTQYVQLVLGFSAFGAGLLLMPALLTWTVASAASGTTSRRWGVRTVTVSALVLGSLGLLLVSLGGPNPVFPVFVAGLILVGALGVVPALMTHTSVSNFPPERRSTGSSVNSMAVRYGLAYGVALYGLVSAWIYRRDLAPSLGDLADADRDAAAESIGGALAVSQSMGDVALGEAARAAFASGFSAALVLAAAIAAGLAWFLWRYLPQELPQKSNEVTQ